MTDLFTALRPRCSMVPRDYQASALRETFRMFEEGVRGTLIRLPTGTGKTLVGSMAIDLWLQGGINRRAIVLADEQQHIEQFADEIQEILHVTPAIEMAERHCRGTERIIVASKQSLPIKNHQEKGEISRLFKFRQDLEWLVVIDECDKWARKLKSCRHIIEWFEGNPLSRRIGLTATPERQDKAAFTGLFPGVAIDYRLHDLSGGPSAVNDGWLVPVDQLFIPVEGVDFENIPEIKGDFDPEELDRIFDEQEQLAKLCKPMLDLVGQRRSIIYCHRTHIAKAVALYLNAELGMTVAKSMDGTMPKELRNPIYRQHQTGVFQFLVVCDLCRRAYNDPGVEAVVSFKMTKSRKIKEQIIGRVLRPLRGTFSPEMTKEERLRAIANSRKPTGMVIDLVGMTGLGDVPSAVDILADSVPDDVVKRANKKLQNAKPGESTDVQKALRDASDELKEERRVAREEREAREAADAAKRAKIKIKVKYSVHKVKAGQAGKSKRTQKNHNPPSPPMCNYLRVLGVNHPEQMAMQQAKALLGKLTSGHGRDYVVRGGPQAGTPLKELPIPVLKELIAQRNTGSKYDNEFQSEVELYRHHYREDHKPKGTT